jgi:hypothetical protein
VAVAGSSYAAPASSDTSSKARTPVLATRPSFVTTRSYSSAVTPMLEASIAPVGKLPVSVGSTPSTRCGAANDTKSAVVTS